MQLKKGFIATSIGSSMVEVLIALFVLAIGILGVLAMQVQSVQLNQNAYLYSQAAFLANDLMESMRTTASGDLRDYASDSSSPVGEVDCSAGCNSGDMIQWHLYRWQQNVTTLLPGGRAVVDDCVNGGCRIEVSFIAGYEEVGAEAVAQRRYLELEVGI